MIIIIIQQSNYFVLKFTSSSSSSTPVCTDIRLTYMTPQYHTPPASFNILETIYLHENKMRKKS